MEKPLKKGLIKRIIIMRRKDVDVKGLRRTSPMDMTFVISMGDVH